MMLFCLSVISVHLAQRFSKAKGRAGRGGEGFANSAKGRVSRTGLAKRSRGAKWEGEE